MIGSLQLAQKKLTDTALEPYRSTLLAYHLGRLKDEIARTSRGILVANGITLEYPIMRRMTNLESVITSEGTEEVYTPVNGEQITGLRAFSWGPSPRSPI